MTETPDNYEASAQTNLAYKDTAAKFQYAYIGAAVLNNSVANVSNFGAYHRHRLATIAISFFASDLLDIPIFNDNGLDKYLPTALDFEVRLARENVNKVLMSAAGRNDANGNLAGVAGGYRLHIKNLKMILPIYKPNEQMRQAINNTMVNQNEECKYYATEYRTIVKTITDGVRNHQATDIFNGKIPTRLYILLVTQDRFKGAHYTSLIFDGMIN